MKKYFKWIMCIIFFIFFIVISLLIITKNDIYLDNYVYNFIYSFKNDILTLLVKCITYLGSVYALILIILGVLILFKNKRYALYMSINLLFITIIQYTFKNIFTRARPIDISLIEESGYSFPSGHSLTAMAFYGLIIYLIYKSKLNKKAKIIFIALFSLLIILIGVSRIYLGVHYATDVLGGFTFSTAYLVIYTSLIKNKLIS